MTDARMMDPTKIDVLWVMCKQEQKVYRIVRPNIRCQRLEEHGAKIDQRNCGNSCRYNMIDWCYRMIDFCHLKREIVAIAMNFADRFVTSKGQSYLMDDAKYQLVVITALYTSIKIHDVQAIDLESLSNLSRGIYSAKEIEELEQEMITALKWRMNPPTAMSFVRSLFDIVSDHYVLSDEIKDRILKLARIQTEHAVFDVDLVTIKASIIAYCSLINALATIVTDNVTLKNLIFTLAQTLQINPIDDKVAEQVQPMLFLLLPNHQPTDCIGKGTVQMKSLFKGRMEISSIAEPKCTVDIKKYRNVVRLQKEISPRSSADIV